MSRKWQMLPKNAKTRNAFYGSDKPGEPLCLLYIPTEPMYNDFDRHSCRTVYE